MPEATERALVDNGIGQVVVLGAESAVGEAVLDRLSSLGIGFTRLGGADRQATAALVADWAVMHVGFSGARSGLARGDDAGGGADALALGAVAGLRGEPVLLADASDAGAATLSWFAAHSGVVTGIDVVGDDRAVSSQVVSSVVAAATTGTAPDQKGTGRLGVEVVGAPAGSEALVNVSGPNGFYASSSASGTLDGLAAGTYRVTAAPAPYPGGVAYADSPIQDVEVPAQGMSQVRVAFGTQVPSTTKALPAASVIASGADPAGRPVLSLEPELSPSIAVGDILAAAGGTGLADGVLGRVEAVATGDRTTVTVTPVDLRDAVPVADFTVEARGTMPDVEVDAGGGVDAAAAAPAQTAGRSSLAVGTVLKAAGTGTSARWAPSCGPATTVELKAEIAADPYYVLDADWNWDGVEALDIGMGLTGRAGLSLSGKGKLGCEVKKEQPVPVQLPSFKFMVGYVPVVVKPKMDMVMNFKGTLSGEFTCSNSATIDVRFGSRYRKGEGFRGYGDESHSDKLTCTTGGAGTAEFLAGPQVDLKVYGVAGPRVAAQVGLSAKVQTINPRWYVDGVLAAKAGLVVDLWKIKSDYTGALQLTWRIAEAEEGGIDGVCDGVQFCRSVASVDVDGDGSTDAVGLVGGEARGSTTTVRLLTASGLLVATVPPGPESETWPSGSSWYGYAQIDGHPGAELVIGSTAYSFSWFFQVLHVRDGRLVALPTPQSEAADDVEWILTDAADEPTGDPMEDYAGRTGFTCLPDGTLETRLASIVGGGDHWETYRTQRRWDGDRWADVSTVTGTAAAGGLPGTWSGWSCSGLSRLP
nr:cell wall-binding repeat-containing protein [Kineococcus aurantiacus]